MPIVVEEFRKLKVLRNKSIHFNPEIDLNDRSLALNAIKILASIINNQFGAFGTQPWFIEGVSGASYIKKSAEVIPFVKKVILPNCVLVGYKHELVNDGRWFKAVDDNDYEENEITDEEYSRLLESHVD